MRLCRGHRDVLPTQRSGQGWRVPCGHSGAQGSNEDVGLPLLCWEALGGALCVMDEWLRGGTVPGHREEAEGGQTCGRATGQLPQETTCDSLGGGVPPRGDRHMCSDVGVTRDGTCLSVMPGTMNWPEWAETVPACGTLEHMSPQAEELALLCPLARGCAHPADPL